MKVGAFKKSQLTNYARNANFENGGNTIQIGILYVLLNILSISLLSSVYDTSCYFKMQKEESCHFTF